MKLAGEVPAGYRGVPGHGRDWLERGYFPGLAGPGFLAVLALGFSVLNATVILVPSGKVYLALCAVSVVGAAAAATSIGGTDDRGAIVPVGVSGLLAVSWAAWIASDFGATAPFHRHLAVSVMALLFAVAWHERRCRYAWWRVILTSDAWNEEALSAYAEFLAARASGPYARKIARELFRTAADLALKPPEPSRKQLDAIRRYVEILREGVGGFPDFREARWWKDKLNEFEDRARDERLGLV